MDGRDGWMIRVMIHVWVVRCDENENESDEDEDRALDLHTRT
jgi:hypothetical protein